ncbi:hypothetical protein [Methylobacterium fujisawaense]
MKRWKLTPLADQPQGPSTHHASEVYEGDEDGLSARLSDLQAQTGTPYEAAEWDGEPDPEPDLGETKERQDEAEAQGRPVEG